VGKLEKMRVFIGYGYLVGLESKNMALKAGNRGTVTSAEILAWGYCRGVGGDGSVWDDVKQWTRPNCDLV